MIARVYGLPAATTFTPEQALLSAQDITMKECLIVGYDLDGDLIVRSSRMNREDALWLCKKLEMYILQVD